jgi:fibronectin-binding autotransporter adhesin
MQRFAASSAAIAILLALALPARAAIETWGSAGTDWNTAANWTGGAVPGSGDVALFNLGAYNNQPSLSASSSASGVWITGGGPLLISGNTLSLFGTAGINGNAATGLELDSGAGSTAVASAVALGGSQTWINNSGAVLANQLTLAGNVSLGASMLVIGGSGNTLISGVLGGSGGLTVSGPGVVTLSGASNSYSGATTINGGTLAVLTWANSGTASSLGEGANVVFDGGTLEYQSLNNASNQFTRNLIVNGGGNEFISTAVSHFWPASISGSGSLTVDCAGGGQFLCNGTSSFSGTISVVAGELHARSSLAYGTGTIVINGGELGGTSKGAASNIANNIDILSNPPAGPALEFHDLGCQPTFSGVITLGYSACTFGPGNGNPATSMTISGLITGSGGLELLEYSGTAGNNAPVYMAGNQSNSYTGPTLLAGSLQGQDDYLYLADTNGAYALAGTNIQFAAIGRARLAIAAPGQQFSPSTVLTFLGSGGTCVGFFQLEGYPQTVAGLNCATGFGVVEASESSSVAGAALTLDGGGDYSYNGVLRDNGSGPAVLSLIMAGGGRQNLSGSNAYSGGTVIDSGTLQLGNSAALGTGALAANGGTLDLAGFGIVVPSFSGAAGTVINSGSNAAALTINQSIVTTFDGTLANGAGPLALVTEGPGTLVLGGTNTYSGGTTVSSGTLVVDSAAGLAEGSGLTVGQGAAAIFAPATPAAGVVAVPEPGTLALLVAALWSAAACRRFSKRY